MKPRPFQIEPITCDNSTVDGHAWGLRRFASLGFASTGLASDTSYEQGCLKFLPSFLDDDPTVGHRVRSIYKKAEAVMLEGRWVWKVWEK